MDTTTREHIEAALKDIGDRKFTDDDITARDMAIAQRYVTDPANFDLFGQQEARGFSFLADVAGELLRKPKNGLSTAKVRGVLNCLRAEYLRSAAQTPGVATEIALGDTPNGIYTVEFSDGSYRTLRIKDWKTRPGLRIVALLVGPDNESSYQGCGTVEQDGKVTLWRSFKGDGQLVTAIKTLAGDPETAGKAYARRSGNCYRCGRTLTTPESLRTGIGPVCAGM